MSAPPYVKCFRNAWLGAQGTAANTVPTTAGLDVSNLSPVLIKASLKINGAIRNVAIVGLLKDSLWKAYNGANVQAAATDDTTDAQSGSANSFAMETANAANSGCAFGAPVPFGAISVNGTTASAGSPVRVVEYWNGTAWTTIAAAGMLNAPPANWATSENVILFIPPSDWVKGDGSVTGLNANHYNLRIRSTTAPTTAGSAGRVYLGYVFSGEPALAANSTHTAPWEALSGWPCPGAVAAISGATNAANEGNVISIVYR